jgi:large subunit ribosomal protein L21
MYAVIRAGGKQQKVKPGDVIEVELTRSEEDTQAVTFTPLLVVDDDGTTHVGKDLGKARVTAKLVGETKGEKVHIFKYRAKTGYSKRGGHRQRYTLVEIEDISVGGAAKRSARKTTPADVRPAPAEEVEGAADVASATAGAAPVEDVAPVASSDESAESEAPGGDGAGAEEQTQDQDEEPETVPEEEGL